MFQNSGIMNITYICMMRIFGSALHGLIAYVLFLCVCSFACLLVHLVGRVLCLAELEFSASHLSHNLGFVKFFITLGSVFHFTDKYLILLPSEKKSDSYVWKIS